MRIFSEFIYSYVYILGERSEPHTSSRREMFYFCLIAYIIIVVRLRSAHIHVCGEGVTELTHNALMLVDLPTMLYFGERVNKDLLRISGWLTLVFPHMHSNHIQNGGFEWVSYAHMTVNQLEVLLYIASYVLVLPRNVRCVSF